MNIENEIFPESWKLKEDESGNLTAQIIDAELDPVECTFNGDGCIMIETHKLHYVTFTPENLKRMAKLIQEAEKKYSEMSSD